MEIETWKQVDGFDGKYSVSSFGRVRNNNSGLVLKQKMRSGYPAICFHVTRKTVKTFSIHRLVAIAFLGDALNMQVNHKDGNKNNNNIKNLEWVTPKENSIHSSKMGFAPSGERNGQSKLTKEAVVLIRKLYKGGKAYAARSMNYVSQEMLALKFGVSRGLIGHIVNGRSWRTCQ